MTEAYDANGNPMELHDLYTICDAADGPQARQYAFDFMSCNGRSVGTATVDDMMNLRLRPIGTSDDATHWGCVRQAWTDELVEQQTKHVTIWGDLPSFRIVESFEAEGLEAIL